MTSPTMICITFNDGGGGNVYGVMYSMNRCWLSGCKYIFFLLVLIALYDSRFSELLVVLNRLGILNRHLISLENSSGLSS